MSKLNEDFEATNLKTIEDLTRFLDPFIRDLLQTINGKLELLENLYMTKPITVTFANINKDLAVSHTLGRASQGYFIVGKKAKCEVWNGTTQNTNTILYLQCDTATTVYIVVF